MAINSQIRCFKCKQLKRVNHGLNNKPLICYDCQQSESDTKRAAHFAELEKLPMKERLRRVEEWIYDYQPYSEPRY